MPFTNVYLKGDAAEEHAKSMKSIANSFARIADAVEQGVSKVDPALVVRAVEAVEQMNRAPLFWPQWSPPLNYWTEGGRGAPDEEDVHWTLSNTSGEE